MATYNIKAVRFNVVCNKLMIYPKSSFVPLTKDDEVIIESGWDSEKYIMHYNDMMMNHPDWPIETVANIATIMSLDFYPWGARFIKKIRNDGKKITYSVGIKK